MRTKASGAALEVACSKLPVQDPATSLQFRPRVASVDQEHDQLTADGQSRSGLGKRPRFMSEFCGSPSAARASGEDESSRIAAADRPATKEAWLKRWYARGERMQRTETTETEITGLPLAVSPQCFLWEAAGDSYAPGPGGPIAKDVSVLQVNHTTLQDVLPRGRQVSRASLKLVRAQKSITAHTRTSAENKTSGGRRDKHSSPPHRRRVDSSRRRYSLIQISCQSG
jgi:hypothetical protein